MSNKRLPDSFHEAKKKRNFERLAERYYGKLDLLATWDKRPKKDRRYINDLRRRLRTHKNDITYRGGEPDGIT